MSRNERMKKAKKQAKRVRNGQYELSSKEEAQKANDSISKDSWIKAIREELWGLEIKGTKVGIKYTNPEELIRYVETIPDELFSEFLTVYGYEVSSSINRQNDIPSNSTIIMDLNVRSGYFPVAYDKEAHFGFITFTRGLEEQGTKIIYM